MCGAGTGLREASLRLHTTLSGSGPFKAASILARKCPASLVPTIVASSAISTAWKSRYSPRWWTASPSGCTRYQEAGAHQLIFVLDSPAPDTWERQLTDLG